MNTIKRIMYKLVKRFFDFLFAFFGILLLSPFFVLLIFILLLTGEHRVFYLQERLGYLNQPFKIIKFATMLKDSPNIGTGSITLRGDARILPFGHFLRKSKINELPQLINVLMGDMSFVGPRPQMAIDLKKFPLEVQQKMYYSKPGITGIGSVVFRDEEKWISAHQGDKHEFYKSHIAPYKGELELWYLKNSNVGVDINILFCTAWVILFPKSQIVYSMLPTLPKLPVNLSF